MSADSNPAAFSQLPLQAGLLKNLDTLGYQAMTPVQAKALPEALAGRDVIVQAKTGSGKTAAFGLALLNKLDVKRFRVQALVLCPTRELADQVALELRRLARAVHNIKVLSLCGGSAFGPQLGSLEHGAHIVVGTPGRIHDHLRRRSLKLADVETLVLDEADRMLDMGFQDTIEAIVGQLPKQRQNLLFSATYPAAIEAIAERALDASALRISVDENHDQGSIKQRFYKVRSRDQRAEALQLLLLAEQPEAAIVFCNTKRDTQSVSDRLRDKGFTALALHGDLDQRDRDQTLVRFANGSACILVATDVAARGLDIDSVDVVVNYDIAHDSEVHTHRVGRTGRAGSEGLALSIFADHEAHKLASLNLHKGADPLLDALPLPGRELLAEAPREPAMVTLQIDGGKKQKLRPGDILGALTGEGGIAGADVGKITMGPHWAYVAVSRKVYRRALKKIGSGKMKGRSFRARRL